MFSFKDRRFSVFGLVIMATVSFVSSADSELLDEAGKPRVFPESFFPSMSGLFSGLGEAGRVAAVMARDASDAWQGVADRRMGEPVAGYHEYQRYSLGQVVPNGY